MKIKAILFLIPIIMISCGPKGATKEDRILAAKQYKKGKAIVDKNNPSRKELKKAYKHFENAKIGYHDDERTLAKINLFQGFINYKINKYAQALNALRKAIKFDKRLRTPYIFLVRIYLLKRRYKNVLYWANKGIEKLKKPYELYYYKGVALYRMKKYTDAETQYQKALNTGAKGNYLQNSKNMILDIKRFLKSGLSAETAKLARYIKKKILTYNDVAKIINEIIPLKTIIITKNAQAQIPSDPYNVMKMIKIFNRYAFLRQKYVSRADFAYIVCNLIEYIKAAKLNVKEKYKKNPGIPDIKTGHYAFSHSLFAVESNIMQLNDDGFFGTDKNLSGIACINSVKKVRQRYYNRYTNKTLNPNSTDDLNRRLIKN